jgi:dTDP-4-dehydrorhamnose 3,5-epimerase-like enzyme
MDIRKKANRRIETRDQLGASNGFLIPIYNVLERFVDQAQEPKQVYCTVVAARTVKGPHLHMKRWGLFTCILGNIEIVVRLPNGTFERHHSGEKHAYSTIQVPAGIPAALVNRDVGPAYVLNMPSPSWSAEDPDDHSVDFGDFDFFSDHG